MKHNGRVSIVTSIRFLLLLGGTALLMWTCKYPSGPLKENTMPHTRLANVPANDTIAKFIDRNIIPELELNWLGDDPDGYVIAYQYRWLTKTGIGEAWPAPPEWNTHLNLTKPEWLNVVLVKSFAKDASGRSLSLFNIYNFLATLGPNDTALTRVIGESLYTERTFAVPYRGGVVATDSIAGASRLVLQTPTIGTFIFESPDTANFHRFDVRAVDNSNAYDPVGASVYFWTLKSPGSLVAIDTRPVFKALAIKYITDTWPGLRYSYHALDPNNQFGIQYQWSVDDSVNGWSPWTSTGEAFVTALDFKHADGTPAPDSSGRHAFYVRARNRWSVESPMVRDTFTVIVPAIDREGYQKRTLIVNADLNGATNSFGQYNGNAVRGYPSVSQVDSVYRIAMSAIGKDGQYSIYRVATATPAWPPIDTLANYTSVLMMVEQKFYRTPRQTVASTFQTDMERYLDVGGKLVHSGTPLFTAMFQQYPLWLPIFHIGYLLTNVDFDFVGSKGILGYPTVQIDTTRLPVDSALAIRNIAAYIPIGRAETISYFDSRSDGAFENLPLGIRFLSPSVLPPRRPTYSVVFFGFPLYYTDNASMAGCLAKAFQDINE